VDHRLSPDQLILVAGTPNGSPLPGRSTGTARTGYCYTAIARSSSAEPPHRPTPLTPARPSESNPTLRSSPRAARRTCGRSPRGCAQAAAVIRAAAAPTAASSRWSSRSCTPMSWPRRPGGHRERGLRPGPPCARSWRRVRRGPRRLACRPGVRIYAGTRWYPLVPAGTRWYPLVPAGTRWCPLDGGGGGVFKPGRAVRTGPPFPGFSGGC
jgi:hypothetical protein